MSEDIGIAIGKRRRLLPPDCGTDLSTSPALISVGMLHRQAIAAGLPVLGATKPAPLAPAPLARVARGRWGR